MGDMGYGYGSEWHLLRFLGRHRNELNLRIERDTGLHALDARVVDWLDFDFARNWTLDGECRRVDFLPQESPARKAWPSILNPSWDAVGLMRVRRQGQFQTEWLLVEAKAHTGELRCDPKAAGGKSKDVIRELLHRTRDRISPINQTDWLGEYYQYANRLFTLDHLLQNGIPARLLMLYFCGDQCTGGGSICPASAEEWMPSLDAMDQALGLAPGSVGGLGHLSERVHKLFLPVSPLGGTFPLHRGFNWPSPRPSRAPKPEAVTPENPG